MRKSFTLGVLSVWLFFAISATAADLTTAPPPIEPPAEQGGIWAAIAYSQIEAEHGFFWGADRRDEAAEAALEHCRNAGGSACRIVAVFRNHRHWDDDDGRYPYQPCGALAVEEAEGEATKAWGAAMAPTRREAQDEAVAACQGEAALCKIREWVCT